jgi:predicted RNA-binding protein with PIN domain
LAPGFFLSSPIYILGNFHQVMTNKIIIDAWNVIWRIPSLSPLIPKKLEQVRSKFNMIIKNHYVRKNVEYKIIYDGQPHVYPINQKQDPKVSFSRNPEKADELIIKFLKKQSSPKLWTVITSDRYLAHQAKNLGAHILSTEIFITKIIKSDSNWNISPTKSDPQINNEDISYWKDKFDPKD